MPKNECNRLSLHPFLLGLDRVLSCLFLSLSQCVIEEANITCWYKGPVVFSLLIVLLSIGEGSSHKFLSLS